MELFDKTEQYDAKVYERIDELRKVCAAEGLSFLLMVHVAETVKGSLIQGTSKQGEYPVNPLLILCQRLLNSPEEAESIMRALWLKDELFPPKESAPEGATLN